MKNNNMRCIETLYVDSRRMYCNEKQQHEMYWNWVSSMPSISGRTEKQQHEMYWNNGEFIRWKYYQWKNNNMRCIETVENQNIQMRIGEKQQHEMYWNMKKLIIRHMLTKKNNNMRCIETPNPSFVFVWNLAKNNNMRCIETLTVPEYPNLHRLKNNNMRCIETSKTWGSTWRKRRKTTTWDVLKLLFPFFVFESSTKNNNMRCIETAVLNIFYLLHYEKQQHEMYWNTIRFWTMILSKRKTTTWDVLKLARSMGMENNLVR